MAIFNSYVKLPEGNNYSPLNLWLFFGKPRAISQATPASWPHGTHHLHPRAPRLRRPGPGGARGARGAAKVRRCNVEGDLDGRWLVVFSEETLRWGPKMQFWIVLVCSGLCVNGHMEKIITMVDVG